MPSGRRRRGNNGSATASPMGAAPPSPANQYQGQHQSNSRSGGNRSRRANSGDSATPHAGSAPSQAPRDRSTGRNRVRTNSGDAGNGGNTDSGAANNSSSGGNSPEAMAGVGNSGALVRAPETLRPASTMRLGRRPFLHVVVLYGSDPRAQRYAREVRTATVACGIDTMLQMTLRGPGAGHVRSENLADVIGSSAGDYVAVVGDRNIRHRTVQAQRRGKLVEVEVPRLVDTIWNEWLRRGSATAPHGGAEGAEKADQLLDRRLGVRHVAARVKRIEGTMAAVSAGWAKAHGSSGKGKRGKKRGGNNAKNAAADSENAEQMSLDLALAVKWTVRLHQQLAGAHEGAMAMAIEDPRADAARAVIIENLDYVPESVQTELVSKAAKDALLAEVARLIALLVKVGDEITRVGNPMWKLYFSDFKAEQRAAAEQRSSVDATPEQTPTAVVTGGHAPRGFSKNPSVALASTSSVNTIMSQSSKGGPGLLQQPTQEPQRSRALARTQQLQPPQKPDEKPVLSQSPSLSSLGVGSPPESQHHQHHMQHQMRHHMHQQPPAGWVSSPSHQQQRMHQQQAPQQPLVHAQQNPHRSQGSIGRNGRQWDLAANTSSSSLNVMPVSTQMASLPHSASSDMADHAWRDGAGNGSKLQGSGSSSWTGPDSEVLDKMPWLASLADAQPNQPAPAGPVWN